MRAREKYLREVANEEEDEEVELDVFDGEDEEGMNLEKEQLKPTPPEPPIGKRKRPLPMDPFILESRSSLPLRLLD